MSQSRRVTHWGVPVMVAVLLLTAIGLAVADLVMRST